ncbi:uncharacterized protein C8R40DRAFT_579709 [Lentinula edodes]|uniref:uncharacterized protein n=1 Tax=Lentinula edodes TaxID=5353 RepID=UPI001E8CD875|nr:uncharacterized protein C8R40DRAFT_579709 [Lentinula edodes]KAH7879172.1 hypothetical protein C8R40DRAFT_579709 [Lentinula edodes]
MMIFYTYNLLLELHEFVKSPEPEVSDVNLDLGPQGIFMHRMHLLLSRGGSGGGLPVNKEDFQPYTKILTQLPFDYKKPPSERIRPSNSPLQLVQFFLIHEQNRRPFRCFKEEDTVGRDESWTFVLKNTVGGLWGLQATMEPNGTWVYAGEEKRNYVHIKQDITFYAILLGSLKATPDTVKTVLTRLRQVPADVNLLYFANLYEAAEEMVKSPEFSNLN